MAGLPDGGYQIIHSRSDGMTPAEMRTLPVIMHETPMRANSTRLPGAGTYKKGLTHPRHFQCGCSPSVACAKVTFYKRHALASLH